MRPYIGPDIYDVNAVFDVDVGQDAPYVNVSQEQGTGPRLGVQGRRIEVTNHPNRSKYAIHVEPHYYAGDIFGNDRAHLLRGYRSDAPLVVLSTSEDAILICRMMSDHGDGPYILAHNQYAAPEYSVERYRGKAPALNLREAMSECGLDYDFRPDGTRIELTEAELFGANL